MILEQLVNFSNLYGSNEELVLAGGGNTSAKDGDVMYIKGSGTSLSTITAEGFVKMSREKIAEIFTKVYPDNDKEREALCLADVMASRLPGEESKRPSVETTLHSLFQQRFVLHLHPALVNGVTCAKDGQKWAEKLAIAQRAHKKKRAAAIHAKVANIRKDYLHKRTTALVRRAAAIFVGSVPVKWMASGRKSKKALDGAAGMFKAMLAYKANAQQVWFEEIDEKWTSQSCSVCGSLPPERPQGEADLGIREWACSGCGSVHDRDVNAARNILARGLARLEEGIPAL